MSAAQHEARLIRRIRALWRLANHPATPPDEAKAARRLAGYLMADHRITADDLERGEVRRGKPRSWSAEAAPAVAVGTVTMGVATMVGDPGSTVVAAQVPVTFSRVRIQFADGTVYEVYG